jgi:hypothetical protein
MTHLNEETLVEYLYEEGDPAERLKTARHLQDCAACSVAVLELQSVRGLLSEWRPPDSTLGFKIVQEAPAGSPQRWWRMGASWPTWAQAAAGVLVFAAGMAVSQLHVEYGNGALTLRAKPAAPLAEASIMGNITLPAMPVNVSNPPEPAGGERGSVDDVLHRVKAMIDQSEGRQQRELALRLSQVVQDFDAQRRADMSNVEQNIGQIEGQTGAEVAHQRELLNSLVKVSQQAK